MYKSLGQHRFSYTYRPVKQQTFGYRHIKHFEFFRVFDDLDDRLETFFDMGMPHHIVKTDSGLLEFRGIFGVFFRRHRFLPLFCSLYGLILS